MMQIELQSVGNRSDAGAACANADGHVHVRVRAHDN